jgi:putative aldouronate transport system permease protein
MIIPGVILLIVFSYMPMAGLVMAFNKFNPGLGMFGSPWVGWDHFTYFLSLSDTPRVIFNTLNISLMKLIVSIIVPVVVSLMLNEIRLSWYKRGVQTLIYLPYFISWVILGGIFFDLLSSTGLVNSTLGEFNIGPVSFFGDNTIFPFVAVGTDLWKNLGYKTIIYLAAITNINPGLYEAATVDGAGYLKRTWHVTLPGMIPIIVLLTTIDLGQILNTGLEQLLVLTQNGQNTSSLRSGEIIDTFVYKLGFVQANFSLATAVGLMKSIVSFFLISLSYLVAYKTVRYRIF